jgi:hypothetical protein
VLFAKTGVTIGAADGRNTSRPTMRYLMATRQSDERECQDALWPVLACASETQTMSISRCSNPAPRGASPDCASITLVKIDNPFALRDSPETNMAVHVVGLL